MKNAAASSSDGTGVPVSKHEAGIAERGSRRRWGGYHRPGGHSNYEVNAWVFMRISGLLLIFLSLYHLFWWNIVVGVEHTSAAMVIERWSNPFWRLYDLALLLFAMLHGLNGARYSIEDYIRRPGAQFAVKSVVYTVTLTATAIGAWALLTFDHETLQRVQASRQEAARTRPVAEQLSSTQGGR